MSNKFNVIIGVILVLLPFLGFPREVKNTIFVAIGVLIVSFTLRQVRKEQKKKGFSKDKNKDVFAESRPSRSFTNPRPRKPKIVVQETVQTGEQSIPPTETTTSDSVMPGANEQ